MGFKIWCQVSKFDVKLGVVVKNFKITAGRWLFVFYPPKRRLPADSSRCPIVFTYVLFWVRKTLETFKFTDGFSQKKKNLKMFYPPKGRLLADSSRGPIVLTYVLFWVRKTLEAFQFYPPFWSVANVLSPEGTSACRLQ